MNAMIAKLTGAEAWDLISTDSTATMVAGDREIMEHAMRNADRVWVGYRGGEIMACWGLKAPTLLSDCAYLWLWTSPASRGHEFLFVRHSQRAVATMLTEFPVIIGHCDVRNPRAIRWLRWLGAQFGEPGGRDCLALPFTIRAQHG